MKHDVIIIGSATRDVFLNIEDKPTFKLDDFTAGEAVCFGLGSKVAIDKMVFATGGGATNMAVTFARQGFKTACVSVVGSDFNGQEILDELAREGVETKFVQQHSDDYTGYSVILVGKGGERTVLSYKGEGQHFEADKINFDTSTSLSASEFETEWLVLNSLGGHFDVLEKAVAWGAEHGVKLAANFGGKDLAHGLEKLKPLLKNFSVVIMNQEEAAQLTGIDYKKEKEIFNFMDSVVDGIFVMTKGREGSSASDGKRIYTAGVPDSPVVERTGAGDAFCAGFLSEYIRSDDIKKAIQFGTANASSVVMYYGAKEGILKKDDTGGFDKLTVNRWPLVEVREANL